MFRTITALLIALAVAIVIGAFQIAEVTTGEIFEIMGSATALAELSEIGTDLFLVLMKPYTTVLIGGYAPLAALGVAGFVAGLISKSGIRMLFVSIIAIAVFFVGYAMLSMSAAPGVDLFLALAQDIAIDIGVAFGLLFIPGVIGASLTSEDY